ncbi:hypothetical protein F4802DRAFT_112763 [Xylaria palmicola]|nr:hypothetical protein F4802DRAFT_112763 [Xylaria palmicola]
MERLQRSYVTLLARAQPRREISCYDSEYNTPRAGFIQVRSRLLSCMNLPPVNGETDALSWDGHLRMRERERRGLPPVCETKSSGSFHSATATRARLTQDQISGARRSQGRCGRAGEASYPVRSVGSPGDSRWEAARWLNPSGRPSTHTAYLSTSFGPSPDKSPNLLDVLTQSRGPSRDGRHELAWPSSHSECAGGRDMTNSASAGNQSISTI